MVLITVDGKLYATEGITDRIRTERELSGIT